MTNTTPLAFGLRTTAIAALGAALVTWVATGAHVGWTQTSIVTVQHDEITGIDYPVRQPGFVAGLEILLVGGVSAAALGGASLLSRRRPLVRE